MSDPKVKVGHQVGTYEGTIDAGHARAYALATNDPTPAYFDDGVVPPVFTVSLGLELLLRSMAEAVPPGAVRNARGGVHGTHETRLARPLMAGEALTGKIDLYATAQTSAGAMVSHHFALTDAEGAVVAEHWWNLFSMGGEVDVAGPALPDHTFPESARERPLGELTVGTTEDQTFRYAGASFDHATIHMHDSSAQRVGFPRKFLQGLCTFAFCSQAVVHLASGDDPRPIRRLAGRFSSPVFPGNDVTIRVYDAGPTPEGRRGVAFEAFSDDKPVLRHGWAELE